MKTPTARLFPPVVLLVGLVTTGVLYGSILRTTRERHLREFDTEVERLTTAIDDAVAQQVAVLNATAGIVAANPDIGQRRFSIFYQNLTLGKEAQVPAAIGLSLWRPWETRRELVDEADKRGVKGFHFRPPERRSEAHAVMLLAPFDALNATAPGFDMHADPVRRAAMDQARTLDRAVMTGKVFLAKDQGAQRPAMIVYLPVRDPRDQRSIGLVFSALRADDLFQNLFAGHEDLPRGRVRIRLWTGEASAANLILQRGQVGDVVYRLKRPISLRSVKGALQAEIVASSDFGAPGAVRPYVLPVGVALSTLLYLLASSLRRTHEATARREAEQSLLVEVGRLSALHVDTDDVLHKIAETIAATLSAACRIDLLEPNGSLRTIDTRTEGAEARLALERDYPRSESDVLFQQALVTGETQRSKGYAAIDPRHRALLAPLNVGAVLVVPLWLGDHAIGAMTFVRPEGAEVFSSDAAALAETMAGRIALAIENARLYRDLERRVEDRTRELEASTRELQASTRDLEASNHELESFCYSVSHDLRTPLRSLDGFGKALREDYADQLDDQALDYIDRIRAATKRMDELITALLTLSRLTRREIVPSQIDVTTMVRDQMQDLDPEGKIDLLVEEGLSVVADPRMLAVLFDNLLSNAAKFTSKETVPRIEVGRTADGSISVRDNGAGFDMAYASKLFQPFERLHSVREFAGHGIGLATVERIVRRHGGEVRAEGTPGEGATFFVRFPE